MRIFLSRSLALIFLCSLFFSACKSTKTTATKYVGEWHYSIEWDGTSYPMKMIISKTDEGYVGRFSSEFGDLDMDDLAIEDDKLTATYDFQGNLVNFTGTFEGDTFKGLSSASGYEFPMEATRKVE